MIKEDTIIKLDDNKEYYVLDSLVKDNNNFIMIGEIDSVKDEITNNVKIMYYDSLNNKVRKITDPGLLYQLVVSFADRQMSNEE
ncbi:MAG: hypothetical protein MSH29_01495 [Tenericutes bacterium]|nr:hypothetical protein [Mycoplasmatota bacterium]MDD7629447.1 hypothetical protein [bacterium]MDY4108439.1 hypothetical protein [Bacilli bacterium]